MAQGSSDVYPEVLGRAYDQANIFSEYCGSLLPYYQRLGDGSDRASAGGIG